MNGQIDFKSYRPSVILSLTETLILFLFVTSAIDAAPRWSWQESYAEVDPRGDLKWNPRRFQFEKTGSVRYIDFEAGNDANSGEATATPWKHHPWDPAATAEAKACTGPHTYVF